MAPSSGSSAKTGSIFTVQTKPIPVDPASPAQEDIPRSSITKVELYANGTAVGSVTSAPWSIPWTVAAGTTQLMVKAYDDYGQIGSSTSIQVIGTGPLSGYVDGLTGSPATVLAGWACDQAIDAPATVEVWLSGGPGVGRLVASQPANIPAEPAVAAACRTPGSAHRYAIDLAALRRQYAGQSIHVRALSLSGGDPLLLYNSGKFTVPALPPGPVVGYVDGLSSAPNGEKTLLSGWACDKVMEAGSTVEIWLGATKVAQVTADKGGAPAIADACLTSNGNHRWEVDLSAYRGAYAGQSITVRGVSLSGGATVTLPTSGAWTVPALPPGPVAGTIERVTNNAAGQATVFWGWACDQGKEEAAPVEIWLGGDAGRGVKVATVSANGPGEAGIAGACRTQSTAHRWAEDLSKYQAQYGGQAVYFRALSLSGGQPVTLANSGNWILPALPAPTVSVTSSQSGQVVAALNGKANLSVTVTASATAGLIKRLDYVLDGSLLQSKAVSTGSVTDVATLSLALGDHRLVVNVVNESGISVASQPLSVSVVSGSNSLPATVPLTMTPPHQTDPEGGALAGEMMVTPGGSAHYTLPLVVPPGTGGMQPALALEYDSQQGNGLLGVGWRLGGLSQVSRCEPTLAQDGKTQGITFGSDDRLCLDGQRLVLVKGGDYWAADAEYRTELESFTRITAQTTSNGKRGFKVETKAGKTMWYGFSDDSYHVLPGRSDGQAMRWGLSKISDRYGNTLQVNYRQDPVSGELLPLQIRYGGNEGQGNTAADLAVRFEYDNARSDSQLGYEAGYRHDMRSLLTHVRNYINVAADGSGGDLVHDYRLSYAPSGSSGRLLLQQAQGCDGQGNCLPATKFSWGKGSFKIGAGQVWHGSPYRDVVWVDVLGNGRSDMIRFDHSTPNDAFTRKVDFYLSTGSDFKHVEWATPFDYKDVKFGDDGSGLKKMYFQLVSGGWKKCSINNSSPVTDLPDSLDITCADVLFSGVDPKGKSHPIAHYLFTHK